MLNKFDVEGAAQVALLQKRVRDLAIAFENIDRERCYWRRQAERLQALIAQMQSLMRPYEGQDNVTDAPKY